MLAKQLEYLGGAQLAGIVLGARVPTILTSRADSAESRAELRFFFASTLLSMLLVVLLAVRLCRPGKN